MIRAVPAGRTGDLRLLLDILSADRPWRLVSRLSRALVAAPAVDILAPATSDIGDRAQLA
jgi:hypothetical protein